MDKQIKFEDLIDRNSSLVKAIIYIYTIETVIPYSLNEGIRDRDKNVH